MSRTARLSLPGFPTGPVSSIKSTEYRQAHAPRGVQPRPRSGPSEWNVVVEIVLLVARARRAGVFGIGIRRRTATAAGARSAAPAAAPRPPRPLRPAATAAPPAPPPGPPGTIRRAATSTPAAARAAAAAEHLQLIPDDLGRKALVAL